MRRVLIVLSLLVSARTGAAQLATSYEIGLPAVPPEDASLDLLLVGVRVSSIKPLSPGVDCEFIVLPVVLAQGVLIFASGFDATYPLPISRSVLIAPRVGVSVLAVGAFSTSGGFEAEPGYNVGGGLVWRTDPKTAVRVDFGRHWFDEYAVNVVTIGVVTVP
jgi:hypothetical protein